MSTTISITVGSLTSSVSFEDDAKTAEILRRYYLYLKLGPNELQPGQEMLDHVVRGIAQEIGRYAVQQYIDQRRDVLEAQLVQEAEAAANFVFSTT